MNLNFTPFKIGEQYENWEFDLEPDFKSKHLEKYRYIANDIADLFKIPTHEIYLYFNLDILCQAEFVFKAIYFQSLKEKLIECLASGTFNNFRDRLEWENSTTVVILERYQYRSLNFVRLQIRGINYYD